MVSPQNDFWSDFDCTAYGFYFNERNKKSAETNETNQQNQVFGFFVLIIVRWCFVAISNLNWYTFVQLFQWYNLAYFWVMLRNRAAPKSVHNTLIMVCMKARMKHIKCMHKQITFDWYISFGLDWMHHTEYTVWPKSRWFCCCCCCCCCSCYVFCIIFLAVNIFGFFTRWFAAQDKVIFNKYLWFCMWFIIFVFLSFYHTKLTQSHTNNHV